MVGRRRGLGGVFSAALPEKRILIQSAEGTRYLRVSSGLQVMIVASVLAIAGFLAFAAAKVAVDAVAADAATGPTGVLHEAYSARLDALAAERDQRAAEALSAQSRFQTAMEQIGRQQTALLHAVEDRQELATALDLMRSRVGDAVAQRDAALAANDELLDQVAAARATLAAGGSDADLTETLQAVTGALSAAVVSRDAAETGRAELASALAQSELELKVTTRRQNEMIGDLKAAVAEAFGPLEGLLKTADLDVDSVLATMRQAYSGQGGPLVPIGVSTRSFPETQDGASQFDELMLDIDRMNLLRIAIGKVPYAMPVLDTHRFTSNFGYRRDPKGGGRRMHAGVDFAAPNGTPLYATADGVVTSAGSESGYGKVVRIQHDFGFETVYAHQSRIRVAVGQRVSRGERIGDMGRTGRVTGVHLHYEVRLNGRPVNPMTYVEAARNVF